MRLRLFLLLGAYLLSVLCTAQNAPLSTPNRSASCGPITDQVLRCPAFGFAYKVPFGWVNRTEDIQNSSAQDSNDAGQPGKHSNDLGEGMARRHSARSQDSAGKAASSETLLAIFERPPDAPGQTINSAVVIAAESREMYPMVKTAADYFGPISDIAEQRGLKAEGGPYAFHIGAKQLVRADFSGERGKLPIFQSSLAMIEHGEIVSFTFLGGSADAVEELLGNLSFNARRAR